MKMNGTIQELVPHQGEMCLLDRVVSWDDESIVAEVEIPCGGLFVEGGGVPAWLGIEYMAQAIAAWAGCHTRLAGLPPKAGFLLGTRRYTSQCSMIPSGTLLQIHARCELRGENGLGMFSCRMMAGENELAAANVTVFEPADALQFLESGTVC